MGLFRRKKDQKKSMALPMLFAVRMISVCAPCSKVTQREEFEIATQELIASGSLTPEKIPWLLRALSIHSRYTSWSTKTWSDGS